MTCQLCLSKVNLIKKSHIIPDFMYEGLFDEKHFMSILDVDKKKVVSRKPDGIYDKHILCAKCDNEVIGSYESYASKLIMGGKLPYSLQPRINILDEQNGSSRIQIQNIDYNKFKLFLLSILWRGHISKNTFFNKIDLGKYAEEIRNMLLNQNAGFETDFETMMFIYHKDHLTSQSLIPARRFRIKNSICYLIYIQSISIIYKVSKGESLDYFDIGKPKKLNEMDLYLLRGKMASDFFKDTTGFEFRN